MTTRSKTSSLINRTEIRRFILAQFEKQHPAVGITRVSAERWTRSSSGCATSSRVRSSGVPRPTYDRR